jgi:hypothetical protein
MLAKASQDVKYDVAVADMTANIPAQGPAGRRVDVEIVRTYREIPGEPTRYLITIVPPRD